MNPYTARVTVLAAAVLSAAPVTAQNLFKARHTTGSVVQDLTAKAVGDILSITIRERHKVKNEDKVERDNTTTLAAQLESYSLSDSTFKTNTLPEIDIRQLRQFDGRGKQEKDSNFEASMAVMIVDVMPNGNLVIAGSRMVQVDDETKTLRISGVVRPLDITATNSIPSSLVAEARVSITGEGGNTRMTTRGPLGAFFDTVIWFAWPF